jgi:glutamate--cysteine ligase
MRASAPDTPEELSAIIRNKQRVAARGREPGLRLICGADEVPLIDWGARVLAECEPIAAALDAAAESRAHRDAIESARARLADPASTPSARVLQAMEREHGNSYVRFVLTQSRQHREAICKLPLAADVAERFARLAAESRVRQREIEAADKVSFEVYRQKYLDPSRLTV